MRSAATALPSIIFALIQGSQSYKSGYDRMMRQEQQKISKQ
ncbi:hypothetical protein LP43_1801 [Methylophaga thiooxydans]|uniref:Uncharacterized protein n=1 Tax=Methylophaga thiooxydans TaxID=392484 RepID=A0A0A0BFW8_9GAMM|nr:hypothetical protein LP43_1801 [Methylophaga thiooxydans]